MIQFRNLVVLGSAVLTLVLPLAANATSESIPWIQNDRRNLACMASVVRAAPGTERIFFGLHRDKNRADIYPRILWRFVGAAGPKDILFEGMGDSEMGHQYFRSVIPGGLQEEGMPPHREGWGMLEIVKEWRAKCNVTARIESSR